MDTNNIRIDVKNIKEYGSTKFIDSVFLYFRLIDDPTYLQTEKEFIRETTFKIEKSLNKMKFCLSDGIQVIPDYRVDIYGCLGSTRPPMTSIYYVKMTLKFEYAHCPNYYKLKNNGLLPVLPEYDDNTFQYMLIHSFEPIFGNVQVHFISIKEPTHETV